MIVFPKKTLRDIDVRGKVVLVRVDYNVPLHGERLGDDWRISASLPTLRYLAKHGAKIVLISHLGWPEGRIMAKMSLEPVAEKLAKLWPDPVHFAHDTIGDRVKVTVKNMLPGEITLLENLRFYPEEEANDPKFAEAIVKSTGARYFVQDGFGVIHRAHASTVAIADFLPSVAGLLLEKEWLEIMRVISDPNRPLTAILGGAKMSDKLPLIKKILKISDNVVVGGAIANNFLVQAGFPVGASLWDPDLGGDVEEVLVLAKKKFGKDLKKHFVLPVDLAVSRNGSANGARRVVSRRRVSPNNRIFDLGTKSIGRLCEIAEQSGTVIWAGTLGLAERDNFAHASSRLALSLADNPQIYSLICGGDTVDFVRNWDNLKGASFSHLSTGGGASLALMAGETLPGLDNLIS